MDVRVDDEANRVESAPRHEEAEERSNLYAFLAAVFREEPAVELIRRVRDPGLRTALESAGVTFTPEFLAQPEARLAGDLAIEYARLFLGPGHHISPHESVHVAEGGRLWGEATTAVKDFIDSAGIDFSPDFTGIPDHIGVELEFMHRVTATEALAAIRGDTVGVRECRKIERRFMEEHLARWVPCFCETVMSMAEHQFYGDMAGLTAAFIRSEREELGRFEDDRAGPV